jgi:hypothetical protein
MRKFIHPTTCWLAFMCLSFFLPNHVGFNAYLRHYFKYTKYSFKYAFKSSYVEIIKFQFNYFEVRRMCLEQGVSETVTALMRPCSHRTPRSNWRFQGSLLTDTAWIERGRRHVLALSHARQDVVRCLATPWLLCLFYIQSSTVVHHTFT